MRNLQREDVKIIYFPRYRDEERKIRDRYPKLIIPKNAADTQSLMYYASLVITGGGTMAREGALLGTPSIYLFPKKLYVNQWLKEKGFPIKHITKTEEAVNYTLRIIRDPERYKVKTKKLIDNLKSPTEPLIKILSEMR